MLGPLVLLSVCSIAGGYLGIPVFLGEHAAHIRWDIAGTSVTVIAVGAGLAWLMYGTPLLSPTTISQRCRGLYTVLAQRYYIDRLYGWYVETIQQRLITGACALVERFLIIGFAVNGTARLTQTAGRLLRRCQTGKVQWYALVFLMGIAAFLYLAVHA